MLCRLLFVGFVAALTWEDLPAQELPVQELPAQKSTLGSDKSRHSYAFGLSVGRHIKSDGLELDLDVLIQGIRDALSGAKPKLNDTELNRAMMEIEQEMVRRVQERAAKNLKEGRDFLAKNKARKGVVALDSGLQYEVIKRGEGESPKITDTVTTHYHGQLLEGTVFDSSVQRGRPATFAVGQVIRGWTEALQRMKVGDKWKIYIPSELAYGPQGAGGMIGPNAVLIFEVELLGIEK